MKPKYYLLFILGLFLIGAGIYLATFMKIVITGYREVPIVPSNLTKGYFKQAISAQTQPYTTIGITILIIGALFLALSMVEIIESLRYYRVHSRVKM
jgi:asparagine N-glycosylation enzyme membrane subunit Stt3